MALISGEPEISAPRTSGYDKKEFKPRGTKIVSPQQQGVGHGTNIRAFSRKMVGWGRQGPRPDHREFPIQRPRADQSGAVKRSSVEDCESARQPTQTRAGKTKTRTLTFLSPLAGRGKRNSRLAAFHIELRHAPLERVVQRRKAADSLSAL